VVIVARGLQIDLRVVPPDSWGAALVYFTGSKEHNVRLRGHALKKKLLLNEYGLYRVGAEARGQEIASRTEEEIYGALGMTNGLGAERITARIEEARRLNEELAPFRILVGTEVDIRANGTLDYPEDMLTRFDIVSASVHSAFGQTREVMTERVLSAMRHPLVTALSHPTGRLLERRDPHAVDLEAVIDAAVQTGTWIEINGGPERLDLPDVWVRKALDKGVTLVANSDAHSTEELEWMEFAIATARRGWAPRPALANTFTLDEMLAKRKRRG
jgi:DNA polymerase (family 10)